MINEETKKYIPYGAAALGGFVGNWLFKKYPKFGMAGKLIAIAGGVAGGYYISKTILGEKVELPFKNAVNSTEKQCRKNCGGMAYQIDSDGNCLCSQTRRREGLFSNAVQTGRETKLSCKNGFILCQQRDLFDDGTTGEWNNLPNNDSSCEKALDRNGNPCLGRASRQRRATSTM